MAWSLNRRPERPDALEPSPVGSNLIQVRTASRPHSGSAGEAITGDTALRLAHFFGTSPEFWLNLPEHSTSCAFAEAESRLVKSKSSPA